LDALVKAVLPARFTLCEVNYYNTLIVIVLLIFVFFIFLYFFMSNIFATKTKHYSLLQR